MKSTNEVLEKQKKNYLKQLSSYAKELDKKSQDAKITISEKEARKEKISSELTDTNKQSIVRISELEKSLTNLNVIYESKLKEKKSLEEAIRRRTEILNDSSSKLKDVES